MTEPVKIIRTVGILILSLTLLSGCKTEREEELEQQVATLESQLDDARSRFSDIELEVDDLRGKVNDLNDAVAEFEYTNWRDVVPDVEAAAADVDSAVESIELAVSDAVSAI